MIDESISLAFYQQQQQQQNKKYPRMTSQTLITSSQNKGHMKCCS